MATKKEKTMKEVSGKNKLMGVCLSVVIAGVLTIGLVYVVGLMNWLANN